MFMRCERTELAFAGPFRTVVGKAKKARAMSKGSPGVEPEVRAHLRPRSVEPLGDADWRGQGADKRSTSGGIIESGGCPLLTWSRTQNTVSLSSAESEYHAMTSGVVETMGMDNFLRELGYHVRTALLTDSQAAYHVS